MDYENFYNKINAMKMRFTKNTAKNEQENRKTSGEFGGGFSQNELNFYQNNQLNSMKNPEVLMTKVTDMKNKMQQVMGGLNRNTDDQK